MNFPVGLGAQRFAESLLHLYFMRELLVMPGERYFLSHGESLYHWSLMFPGLQITQYTLFSQTATRCKHGRLVLFTSNYHITILSLRPHIAAQLGFHFILMKTYSWYIFTKWLIFQMAQADKPKDLSKRDMLLQSNSITHNPNLQREFHLHLPHHPNTR